MMENLHFTCSVMKLLMDLSEFGKCGNTALLNQDVSCEIRSVSLLIVEDISPFVYRKRNPAPGSNEILCLGGVHQI